MKTRYTLGMLVVLGALLTYVLAFERQPVDDPAFETASATAKENILSQETADILALEVDQNAPALSIALQRTEDKKWVFAEGQPADTERLEMLMSRISPWQAAEVLEEDHSKLKLSEFGLEPPELLLRLTTASGTETVQIGSKTPTSSGYYAIRQGDPRLYLAYVNVPEDLQRLLAEPPVAPSAEPEVVSTP